QHVLLRPQMPLSLRAWRQLDYHALAGAAPYVCLTGVGDIEVLALARDVGTVGYTVGEGVRGDVWVFQYPTRTAAASALGEIRAADCPDTPTVVWGAGPYVNVEAVQSSHFSSAARIGIETTVRFPDPHGVQTFEHRLTTQRGLAVIQTTVGLAAGSATATRQRVAARLDRGWHRQVLAAYEAFGSGGSR
ncbi:MAG: hypothetical protein NTX29_13765, partial [Actinobacteria bacterium]|nr:hypothetical protein [Actinomycetota bacterium]